VRKRPLRRAANAAFTGLWTAAHSLLAIGETAVSAPPTTLQARERRWAEGLLRVWGIELSVTGLANVPRGERLVMICNHQSYIDVVALFSTLPELPVFLAKQELRAIPLFGRAMGSIGHVFVDRGHKDQAQAAIERAGRALKPGFPVVVFPEGTRTTRPVIQPFKKGAFHLAKAAAAPILPMGIVGSLECWPRGTTAPAPGPVSLRIGEPIPAPDVVALPMDQLMDRARSAVSALTGLPPGERSADRTGQHPRARR
jgi:1-acyl-sn-glycerol-3-phosphate acyltransferase